MKSKQNEPIAVWIIIVVVLALIAGVFFIDAGIIGTYKARAKALQDSINTGHQYYPDSMMNEDTTFIEDPADSSRGELRREYLGYHRHNGVMRTANVKEVVRSYGRLYHTRSQRTFWIQ